MVNLSLTSDRDKRKIVCYNCSNTTSMHLSFNHSRTKYTERLCLFAGDYLLMSGTPGLWCLVLSGRYAPVLLLVQVQQGYPGHGYPSPPPGQESECCYAAGSKPLAVTQKDFLVLDLVFEFGQFV